MSEEILKALIELFAIIIKQDGGVSEQEKKYLNDFLTQQIGGESAKVYYQQFLEKASNESGWKESNNKKKRTSVLDSVKVLQIGRKINLTLNQSQKVVVLLRCVELVNTEDNITEERQGIVNTLSDIFKIPKEEYQSILHFASKESDDADSNEHILKLSENKASEKKNKNNEEPLNEISILKVPSVELYFLKFDGEQELRLNGLQVNPGIIYLLANGSSIRPANGLPIYYSDIVSSFIKEENIERISMEVSSLGYEFPGHVKGIDDVSFTADQGNLVGIMGASGSGKTTMLNLLAGIYQPSEGKICINNLNLQNDADQLKGVIGYVPQDDLLIEELTVFENLWYNAKFCFGNLSKSEIEDKVSQTLRNLGLYEKRNLKVGSPLNKTISGGQRKRLNIALELIREPAILYLDEPTSGLSSRDSENVMDLLRELSFKGKLIFIVIHQPSSILYKMFDKVIILDEGGKLVYYGNPVEAVIHFKTIDQQINSGLGECPNCGNVNPEQIFDIIEARQVDEFGNYSDKRKICPSKWKEFFEKASSPKGQSSLKAQRPVDKNLSETEQTQREKNLPPPPSTLKLPGWFGQWWNYLNRDFKAKISNRQYLGLVLGVSPALAIILSYIIRYIADPTSTTYIFRENENIPIYIFMAIIVALFLGLIMSAAEIFRDRKILKREKFLNLNRSSYLLAKIVNMMLISAIQTIVFVLIANPVLGIKDLNFHYWLALFSVAVSANLTGLIISSAFNSAATIYIVIPLVMIPMMVLSGAMFSFEKLNRSITQVNKVPIIAEAMPTKWAYEALMVHQFKKNRFERDFYENEREVSRTNFMTSYLIPELEERLAIIDEEFQKHGNVQQNISSLELLKNEVIRGQDSLSKYSFSAEMFLPEKFNADFSSKLNHYFSDLNNFYLKQFMIANRKKQSHLNSIMKQKKELYYSWLNKYHNENVADHVKKIYEKNKIVESNGRLYQQSEPIFLYPESFRAHFYAPVKLLFGKYYDTYWFNIAYIWFLSFILYIILYTDIIAKITETKIFRNKP